MKIVLANGVFDILHVGHVEHLEEARTMGDYLVVSLTVDSAVNKGKGRPLNCWSDRLAVLKALRCVDLVISAASATEAIEKVCPAIFVKGIDYARMDRFTENVVGACRKVGAELLFTKTRKRSATDLIMRTVECQTLSK